jgi:hypothetical protein
MRRRTVRVVAIPHTSSTIMDKIYSENPNIKNRHEILVHECNHDFIETITYIDGEVEEVSFKRSRNIEHIVSQRLLINDVQDVISFFVFFRELVKYYKRIDKIKKRSKRALKIA